RWTSLSPPEPCWATTKSGGNRLSDLRLGIYDLRLANRIRCFESSIANLRIVNPMAQTPSTMSPLGAKAPPFKLPDTNGKLIALDDFKSAPALLVMFICNHCPFVKHVRGELAKLGAEYQKKGVAIVAINSNDVAKYPDDSPAKMKEEAKIAGYTFPYLFDE